MTILKIHTEYIELKNALKLLSFIDTGGSAKPFLMENDVFVNGVKEDRRGRKLYKGDVLKILGDEFLIDYEH